MSAWILIVFFNYNSHVQPMQVGPFADKLTCEAEGTSLTVENGNHAQHDWDNPPKVAYTRCVEVRK